jgi:hypothetical protein
MQERTKYILIGVLIGAALAILIYLALRSGREEQQPLTSAAPPLLSREV